MTSTTPPDSSSDSVWSVRALPEERVAICRSGSLSAIGTCGRECGARYRRGWRGGPLCSVPDTQRGGRRVAPGRVRRRVRAAVRRTCSEADRRAVLPGVGVARDDWRFTPGRQIGIGVLRSHAQSTSCRGARLCSREMVSHPELIKWPALMGTAGITFVCLDRNIARHLSSQCALFMINR